MEWGWVEWRKRRKRSSLRVLFYKCTFEESQHTNALRNARIMQLGLAVKPLYAFVVHHHLCPLPIAPYHLVSIFRFKDRQGRDLPSK